MLDLTLARLRQVRDVILERQAEDRRRDLTVREVELRTTVQFVAAASGSKGLVKDAQKVHLLPVERRRANDKPGSHERMLRLFGGMAAGRG